MKTDKNEKYVFFDLNDGTLNLAQSLANENPRASVVFALDSAAGVSHRCNPRRNAALPDFSRRSVTGFSILN